MPEITTNFTMADVTNTPELSFFKKFLMYTPVMHPFMKEAYDRDPIENMRNIGWSPEGIVAGLNFLLKQVRAGRYEQLFIYNEADCADDPQKQDVNLLRLMPEELDPAKPFIVLCAGGGYNTVCTMVESLPTARHMVQSGYQVFLFTYRVGGTAPAIKALDDLGAAMAFIKAHADRLDLNPSCYAIGGYSAGANLISAWGVPSIGYAAYEAAKPAAMFPIYTFIDLKQELARDEQGGIIGIMFGTTDMDVVEKYNIAEHVDSAYPPCYIVCGKDDDTVPCANSELLKALLDQANVPAVLDEGAHAPHGFGDGTGCDVEGWPERAIAFLESLLK